MVVAGGQQDLEQGGAQAQNASGSLEKLGRGGWRLTTATSGGWGPRPRWLQRCSWASAQWCWGVEVEWEAALEVTYG